MKDPPSPASLIIRSPHANAIPGIFDFFSRFFFLFFSAFFFRNILVDENEENFIRTMHEPLSIRYSNH